MPVEKETFTQATDVEIVRLPSSVLFDTGGGFDTEVFDPDKEDLFDIGIIS